MEALPALSFLAQSHASLASDSERAAARSLPLWDEEARTLREGKSEGKRKTQEKILLIDNHPAAERWEEERQSERKRGEGHEHSLFSVVGGAGQGLAATLALRSLSPLFLWRGGDQSQVAWVMWSGLPPTFPLHENDTT